jgi:hypothetical protein
MNEKQTKSELLASIERYRVASGCTSREAWAAWFDRAGLPAFHYPPPPPAARRGPFARWASMLARLPAKRPAAALAASHRTQTVSSTARSGGKSRHLPPDLARAATTARSGGTVQRAGRITDPGESHFQRSQPLTRRLAFHGSALALAVIAWALLWHRPIWRWQRPGRIREMARAIESRGGTDGQ